MVGLFLLAGGLLFPLIAFAFIAYTRENIPLMLWLLAGTGIAFGVLAWIPYLGVFASVGASVAPLGTGSSYSELIVSLANMSSLIATGLVGAAWILALFQAVRERSQRWISALVVSGIIASLARVNLQYPALILLFGNSLFNFYSLVLEIGLYALTLVGGLTTFTYGAHCATPSGLQHDDQAAFDEDTISTITQEPL